MAVLSDPIADFLTRLKNCCRAGNEEFLVPHSRIKADIAKILQDEGYIWGYEVVTSGKFPELKVKARYVDGRAVLTDVKRISKPGRRVYSGADDFQRVLNGLGISIISTSKGVMSGSHAKRKRLGGEVLAHVW